MYFGIIKSRGVVSTSAFFFSRFSKISETPSLPKHDFQYFASSALCSFEVLQYVASFATQFVLKRFINDVRGKSTGEWVNRFCFEALGNSETWVGRNRAGVQNVKENKLNFGWKSLALRLWRRKCQIFEVIMLEFGCLKVFWDFLNRNRSKYGSHKGSRFDFKRKY